MKLNKNLLAAFAAVSLVVGMMVLGRVDRQAAAASSRRERSPDIEVETELQNRLMAGVDDFGYLIYFDERPDLSPAYEMEWDARGRFVAAALQESAENAQKRVRAYLDAKGVEYQSYWIDNLIVVNRGSSSNTFNGLLDFPEIQALRARRKPILYELETSIRADENTLMAVGSNISHVKADQVWAMGYTGEGIVVANIDTGVRYTHEALVNQYRGNLGGSFDHNYNWWDPAPGGSDLVPNDFYFHGSHTMGTILGSDGAGNQIGMAPGATWIACQGFEQGDQELLECGQFLLAPWDLNGENPDPDLRPHIINSSWGDCKRYLDPWYQGVVSSWHAAGIYPVFSNGNNSNCGYPYPPGLNTVGNPARYGNATGVGSTGNSNGLYAPHSNWGPSDDPDTINPSGYPNLKPQVVAPGVNIRSAFQYSDSAYGLLSGTSMSAPHVAGLVALIWDAAPCLIGDYAATETILQESANPIPYPTYNGDEGPGNVPNHATGWGEIDALAAVQAALEVCPVYTTPRSVDVCQPDEAVFDFTVNETVNIALALGVNGLPGGTTTSFSPNPLSPPGTSVLTIQIGTPVTAGDYGLEIYGVSPFGKYSDTVVLGIRASSPGQPTLLTPVNEAVNVLEKPSLSWTLDDQAESYSIEIGLDPAFSTVVYSATVTTASHQVNDWLAYDSLYYWRVRPENACGVGTSSETYRFRTRKAPPILLVDDDYNGPDVLEYYTSTLETLGYAYAVWDTQPMDREPDAEELAEYDIAIWFTGGAELAYTGPGTAGEAALGSWLDSGKCLLVSSQDYQYARGVTSFMTSYLGVAAVTDYRLHTTVSGAGSVFGDLGPYGLNYPFDNYSDSITPGAGAEIAFIGDQGNAAVNFESENYKTTYWGFPFETLATSEAREAAMSAFLSWCEATTIYLPLVLR
ncbi:MAG: S8 family serine peptidase [Anaerolineales bacterium]|nr:S8 family serine peptidase [Anaerolineales bacterium]